MADFTLDRIKLAKAALQDISLHFAAHHDVAIADRNLRAARGANDLQEKTMVLAEMLKDVVDRMHPNETAYKKALSNFELATGIGQLHIHSFVGFWRDRAVNIIPEVKQEAARHVLWLFGDRERGYEPGGFIASLLRTWELADTENQVYLALSYPEYGAAIRIMRSEGAEALLEWAGLAPREDES